MHHFFMLANMNDLETLVVEMAAGLKLLTGMLGLTVAMLPDAERTLVLNALTALETQNGPAEEPGQSQVATRASAEAAKTLAGLIEKFAAELAATREQVDSPQPGPAIA